MKDPKELRRLHQHVKDISEGPIDLRDGSAPEIKKNIHETPPTRSWEEGKSLRVPIGLEKIEADGRITVLVANSPIGGGDAYIERIPAEDIPH